MNLKAIILLIAGHFVTDLNTGALPNFLPFIKESLRLSYTMTASIILVFNVTSSVIQPIFGYFSDRRPAKWLLPAGCFTASLGMALLGFGSSYAWILFFTALSGLGQGSYHPEAFKTTHSLGGKKKATAISLFLVGGGLGYAVGPLAATLFVKYLGLKGSILFLPFGVAMVIVFLVTPIWRVKTEPLIPKAKSPGAEGSSRQEVISMILLLGVVVLRAATQMSLQTFVPLYFIDLLHRDPVIAGKYISIFFFAGTMGGLAGGPVADRHGYKETVLLGLGFTSIFLFLFFHTAGTASLLLFALAGFMLSSSNAITMAMGQSFMPRNLGMASGLILGLAMGVGGIGTTVLGWVADRWGLALTLQIIFFLPLLGLLSCLFVPYPRRDRQGTST